MRFFFILFPKIQNVSDHICFMYVLKDSGSLDVHREVDTLSGGDFHCIHWPLVVGLIGFQAIVLGFVGYWIR